MSRLRSFVDVIKSELIGVGFAVNSVSASPACSQDRHPWLVPRAFRRAISQTGLALPKFPCEIPENYLDGEMKGG